MTKLISSGKESKKFYLTPSTTYRPDRAYLSIKDNIHKDDFFYVSFWSPMPSDHLDALLKTKIYASAEPMEEITVPAQLYELVGLYLNLSTDTIEYYRVHNDYRSQTIMFFKKATNPSYIAIRGINFAEQKASIVFIDKFNYVFVGLLTYLKHFISARNILPYRLPYIEPQTGKTEEVYITYDKTLQTMIIEDKGAELKDEDKVKYIERENILLLQELYKYYQFKGTIFNNAFTPDGSVSVTKSGYFFINDKKFSIEAFLQLAMLTLT